MEAYFLSEFWVYILQLLTHNSEEKIVSARYEPAILRKYEFWDINLQLHGKNVWIVDLKKIMLFCGENKLPYQIGNIQEKV